MPGTLLWGYDATNKVWIPLAVDANGYVKVDLSNVKLNDLADVSVPTPTDGYVLYWDNATSLWKCKAHTDLKTGIHGVGARYVAETSVEDLDLAAHVSRHGVSGADPIPAIFLADIVRAANFQMIPTAGGWTEALSGSGVVAQSPFRMLCYVNAGAAGSYARAYTQAYGFNEGASYQFINWDKELFFLFNYARYTTHATLECWVQLGETGISHADLSAKGIGIVAKNYALYGECYGTSRAEHSLNTTLTNQEQVQVAIHLSPGNFVKWYINGSLEATEATAGKYPTGGTVPVWINHAIYDGGIATAALTASSMLQGKMWQGR